MDLTEFQILDGTRHPWELSRAASLKHLLNLSGLKKNGTRVLDIGCGDGYTVSELFTEGQFTIDAVDTSLSEELITHFSDKFKSISFHHSTGSLPKEHYDMITLFDVIEHTEDDTLFLKDIADHATPGAILTLTAPAFNALYSNHDSFLGHYRRYNKRELEKTIHSAGLDLINSGYLFSSLLFLRSCSVACEKFSTKEKKPTGVATWKHSKLLTSMITSFLIAENKLSLWFQRHGVTPPGLSVWAICKKPQ